MGQRWGKRERRCWWHTDGIVYVSASFEHRSGIFGNLKFHANTGR